MRMGLGGEACTPFHPEEVLFRVPYAKNMLTEKGLLMALFNRFPAAQPLATEGVSGSDETAFRIPGRRTAPRLWCSCITPGPRPGRSSST